MRGSITWKMSYVHSNSAIEAHKIRHGSRLKNLTRTRTVLPRIGIIIYNLSGG
jgi:hypothetical protein